MRSICDEMSDEKARFRQASHPQKSMPPLKYSRINPTTFQWRLFLYDRRQPRRKRQALRPDVGEQHMLRVKNGVLLVYADTLSDDADVSITCPKNALFAILTNNQETVAKAVKVEGSAELLTLMMENMNQFPITGTNPFNIIEP